MVRERCARHSREPCPCSQGGQVQASAGRLTAGLPGSWDLAGLHQARHICKSIPGPGVLQEALLCVDRGGLG